MKAAAAVVVLQFLGCVLSLSIYAANSFTPEVERIDDTVKFKGRKFSVSERPFASGSAGAVFSLAPKNRAPSDTQYLLKSYHSEGKQHYREYLNYKVLAQDQVPQCETAFGNGFLIKERIQGDTLEQAMGHGLTTEQKEALVTFMNHGMKKGVFGKDWGNPENYVWNQSKKSWVLIDPEYNSNLARDFFDGRFKGYSFSKFVHESYLATIDSLERKATKAGHPLNLREEVMSAEELEPHHIANKAQILAFKTLQNYEKTEKEIGQLPVRYPEPDKSLMSRLGGMLKSFQKGIFGSSKSSSISNRQDKSDLPAGPSSGSSNSSPPIKAGGAK